MSTSELIEKLPKAELHIHLEGSLEPELLFELATRNKFSLEYDSVEQLRKAYVFSNLQEFLDIYYIGMNVLQTEEDFFDLAAAYFQKALQDNVRHVEAFFDPQAHTSRGIPLRAIFSGFKKAIAAANDKGMSVYLIPCFLRHLPAIDAVQTFVAMEPFLEDIHGVGLDSSEQGCPPSLFVEVYDQARAAGLKTVAHAGEEGPPEYIWQAIDQLKVDRIDHGNRAMEDSLLVNRIVERKIPLTVCPLSNLQLGVVSDLRDHPLRKMLDSGIVATVNSDDPAYFGGYVNENYLHAATALNLSDKDIVVLAKNSFTGSFLPDASTASHIADIEQIEKELVSRS